MRQANPQGRRYIIDKYLINQTVNPVNPVNPVNQQDQTSLTTPGLGKYLS